MRPSQRPALHFGLALCAILLSVHSDAFSPSSRNPSKSSPNDHESSFNRRKFVAQTLGGLATGASLALLNPSPSWASSTARVQKWPGVEYLEPVYEFQLSVQALAGAAEDESEFPGLKKRLEQFFKGAIFSERNLYAGMALTYTNQIRYDSQELPNYIELDQQERFNLIEDTMISLKNLMVSLPASPAATYNKDDVLDYANLATVSLKRWFALIPNEEVARAKELFEASRLADGNKDGKVDWEEAQVMSEENKESWKKRIEYMGA